MKKHSGFTIVEVAIVVVVVAIIATLTLVVFGRVQGDSRDRSRAVDANLIAEALEKYYDNNGEYPSCAQMTATGSTVVTNTLVGTDLQTLLTPKAPSLATNSIQCGEANLNNSDIYAYIGDGTAGCSGSGACQSWTLKYKKESDGQVASISSRQSAAPVAP